ncbi:uncharacterized protein H6S33_009892 [Morchella sextelata]|uniref:uncharacterized protein n=1 Tax=Morchella sextelata TaxID=1174677 RepID=UPI001D054F4B|nr:uncharacterized protein H6S33_009892 [Morchella sextelata]KAH0602224.1 hypothetical protein H6S33_009892 [Morchella sextelata]
MAAPLKLLFLHGYTQSGPLFHAKTKALEKLLLKSLPAGTTLTFPTAPHLLKLSDLPGHTPASNEGGEEQSADNWAWWRRSDATGEYTGLDETWAFLSKLLDSEAPSTAASASRKAAPSPPSSPPSSSPRTPPPAPPPSQHPTRPSASASCTAASARPARATTTSTSPRSPRRRCTLSARWTRSWMRREASRWSRSMPGPRVFANVAVGFVREHMKPVEVVEEVGVEDMDVPF